MPVHDDRKLFEFLMLEGAQAGLSWSTVLAKRENYRQAFADFDPETAGTQSNSVPTTTAISDAPSKNLKNQTKITCIDHTRAEETENYGL